MNHSIKTLLFCVFGIAATSSMQAIDIVVQNNITGSQKLNIKVTCTYNYASYGVYSLQVDKISKIIAPGKKAVFNHTYLPSELAISAAPNIQRERGFKFPVTPMSLSQEKLQSQWKMLKEKDTDPLVLTVNRKFKSDNTLTRYKNLKKAVTIGKRLNICGYLRAAFSAVENFEKQKNDSTHKEAIW